MSPASEQSRLQCQWVSQLPVSAPRVTLTSCTTFFAITECSSINLNSTNPELSKV